MKQLIRTLFGVALMLSVGTSAWAQASADMTANAEVVAQVSVAKNTDLKFGQVTPGTIKTLAPGGTVSTGTASGDEQAGVFTVTKGANTQVNLSFTLPANLVNGSNNLPISFGTASAGLNDGSAQATQTTFDPNTALSVANSGNYTSYFAASSFKVNLGGTVTPATGQAAGTYTATVTLTATYN